MERSSPSRWGEPPWRVFRPLLMLSALMKFLQILMSSTQAWMLGEAGTTIRVLESEPVFGYLSHIYCISQGFLYTDPQSKWWANTECVQDNNTNEGWSQETLQSGITHKWPVPLHSLWQVLLDCQDEARNMNLSSNLNSSQECRPVLFLRWCQEKVNTEEKLNPSTYSL